MDKNINHIIIRNIVISVLILTGFAVGGLLWIWGINKIWPWISNAPTSILIVREVICVILLVITAAVALAIYSNRYKIAKTGEGHQTAYWAVFVIAIIIAVSTLPFVIALLAKILLLLQFN